MTGVQHTSLNVRLRRSGFLGLPGAWVLVDGQYGSTGKGLAASVLAEHNVHKLDLVTSNAGPNSGHTSYGPNNEKIVLCQLPTYSVARGKYQNEVPLTFMNSGSVIDHERFWLELEEHVHPLDWNKFSINKWASVISEEGKKLEGDIIGRIGSTGKGTGGAIALKTLRFPNAIADTHPKLTEAVAEQRSANDILHAGGTVFVEVSQGFSLSLSASGMYPFTTSRDCTVPQALSDAGIHPEFFRGAMMVIRTFPIRVAGNSGPGYNDQEEISWEGLGVEPEITTVTKKVRRVFTFSDQQFRDALVANRPCSLFINFMNYLPEHEREPFLMRVLRLFITTLGRPPRLVLQGIGPLNKDVSVVSAR